jgi:hypothetical protein
MKALTRASQHLADSNPEPAALACTKAKVYIDEAEVRILRAHSHKSKFLAQVLPEIRRMERAVWVTAREVAGLDQYPNESLRFLLQSFIIEGGRSSKVNDAGDADASARG